MADRIELTEEQEREAAEILDDGNEEETPEVELAPVQETPPEEEVTEEAPLPELSGDALQDLIGEEGKGNDPWATIHEGRTPEEVQQLLDADRNTSDMQRKSHERNEESRRTMEAAEQIQREALGVIDHIKGMDADDAVEFVQKYSDGEAKPPTQEGPSQDSRRLQRVEDQLANQQVSGYLSGIMAGVEGVQRQFIKDRMATNLYNRFFQDPEVGRSDWRDPSVMHQMLAKKMPNLLKEEMGDFRAFRKEAILDALDRKGNAQRNSVPSGKGPRGAVRTKPPSVTKPKKPDVDNRDTWEKDFVKQGMDILKELDGA